MLDEKQKMLDLSNQASFVNQRFIVRVLRVGFIGTYDSSS